MRSKYNRYTGFPEMALLAEETSSYDAGCRGIQTASHVIYNDSREPRVDSPGKRLCVEVSQCIYGILSRKYVWLHKPLVAAVPRLETSRCFQQWSGHHQPSYRDHAGAHRI